MEFRAPIFAVLLLLLVAPVRADIIKAQDMGWYYDDGFHVPEEFNYAVGGDSVLGPVSRNFFVFDLGGSSGGAAKIISATLRVFLAPADSSPIGGGYSGFNDEFETWALFDIVTPLAELLNGSGGVAAFDDLGSGLQYGQVDVTAAMQGDYVEVSLNTHALQSLNRASGFWGLGGRLTTNDSGDAGLFHFSHLYPGVEMSVIRAPVSAAGTLPSVALAFALLVALSRRTSVNAVVA